MSRPASIPVTWRCLPFDALLPRTLYALLQLRSAVFVVEQACAFQDLDGADADCMHLLGERARAGGEPELLAYTRLVPAGLKYPEASIGRVVTKPDARGGGLGQAERQRRPFHRQRRHCYTCHARHHHQVTAGLQHREGEPRQQKVAGQGRDAMEHGVAA